MLRIPYVPTPYPDETFGSLLTRLVLYNGSGLWRSVLEETGHGRKAISPFHAIPVQSDRLDRLLDALGYTYPAMLRQLTTLPFWLAFNSATLPKYQIDLDNSTSRGTRLSQIGKLYASSGVLFCPACISDDLREFGEPYIHRQHQLPVSFVCAKHKQWLRLTCQACGVTVIPLNRSLLRPPPQKCNCGNDLSSNTVPRLAPDHSLHRLTMFSNAALSCQEAPWTASQVRTILQYRLKCEGRDFTRRAFEILSDTYGPMTLSSTGLHLSMQVPTGHHDSRLHLRSTPAQLRAPEYCALLSAVGLTFEDFSTQVRPMGTDDDPVEPRVKPHPLTVQHARQELERLQLHLGRQTTGKFQQRTPRLFWLLRLKDSAWLSDRGYRTRSEIPTLTSDRAEIEALLRSTTSSLNNVYNKGAWIRATIRDYPWLLERLAARQARSLPTSPEWTHFLSARAVMLSRALFSILRTEQRPARIHAGLLSKRANLTMYQAQQAIAHCQPLQLLIRAVNDGKDRRLANWGARALILSGARPTSKDVLRHAGLNTTSKNRQHATAAIATFQRTNF